MPMPTPKKKAAKANPAEINGPGRFLVRTKERVYYGERLVEPDEEIVVTLRDDHNLAQHFPWAVPLGPASDEPDDEGEGEGE